MSLHYLVKFKKDEYLACAATELLKKETARGYYPTFTVASKFARFESIRL